MTPQILTAADYHRATSYRRHRLTPHSLDWAHQPVTTKNYPQPDRVPLDRRAKLPDIDYFALVNRSRKPDDSPSAPPDMHQMSTLFRLTHAITARSMHDGQPFYYRSVASAGALYPFELYLAVHQVYGVDPGVYHYDLLDFSLTALRRGRVPELPPVKPGVAASFYITGIFFRSAWKYRSRAYRYVLLDAGHLLENLRLALGALNFSFSIHLDFDDQRAAVLMGLDPQREVCLACVHLHRADAREKMTADADNLQPLDGDILQASTVSKKEVAYAEIAKVHRAGNAVSRSGAVDFPAGMVGQQKLPTSWINLDPPDYMESADYARILEQRRSRRNFIPTSVSKDNLMRFMNLMVSNMGKGAAMPSACRSALVSGLLAGPGMPVPPGFYVLDPDAKRFGPVLDGRLTESMAAACLDQMWLKQAAMHLLFVTDVAALDQAWGPRGYRYAMIEAGRLGQQAYLAAAALGWGACGIGAIYDREAADLLDLTTDEVLLYLVGVGPVKMR